MKYIIYTDNEIIFSPDTICLDGEWIKAKKGLDYYMLHKSENKEKAVEEFRRIQKCIYNIEDENIVSIKIGGIDLLNFEEEIDEE